MFEKQRREHLQKYASSTCKTLVLIWKAIDTNHWWPTQIQGDYEEDNVQLQMAEKK